MRTPPDRAKDHDLRVVVVDDHHVFSHALGTAIDLTENIVCVGRAEGVEEAVRIVAELNPDVVVMDLNLPDGDGFDGTRRVRDGHPGLRVLVLTSEADLEAVARAAAAGASAFLGKDCGFAGLIEAIRSAGNGAMVVEAHTWQRILDRLDLAADTKTEPGR